MVAEDRDGPDDLDELLDIQVFQQVEVDVALENLTSGTGLTGDRRTFGAETVHGDESGESREDPLGIRLMEFTPKGVALDVPFRTAAQGHVVRIGFDVRGAKLPFNFSVKGIVSKVQALDAGREKFEIELTEFDPQYMNALRSVFDQRQNEIERFLGQAKG